jgi:hypothetical protein
MFNCLIVDDEPIARGRKLQVINKSGTVVVDQVDAGVNFAGQVEGEKGADRPATFRL